MKKNNKIILTILAILLFYVLFKKPNKKFYFTDSTEKIKVRKGETFELTFPWYVSTGPEYWWTFDNENQINIVEKVDEAYEPSPGQTPGSVGGGGSKTFKYKAIQKGRQVMHWTRGKGTTNEIVRLIEIYVS